MMADAQDKTSLHLLEIDVRNPWECNIFWGKITMMKMWLTGIHPMLKTSRPHTSNRERASALSTSHECGRVSKSLRTHLQKPQLQAEPTSETSQIKKKTSYHIIIWQDVYQHNCFKLDMVYQLAHKLGRYSLNPFRVSSLGMLTVVANQSVVGNCMF